MPIQPKLLNDKDDAVYDKWNFTNTKAFAAEVSSSSFTIRERETASRYCRSNRGIPDAAQYYRVLSEQFASFRPLVVALWLWRARVAVGRVRYWYRESDSWIRWQRVVSAWSSQSMCFPCLLFVVAVSSPFSTHPLLPFPLALTLQSHEECAMNKLNTLLRYVANAFRAVSLLEKAMDMLWLNGVMIAKDS